MNIVYQVRDICEYVGVTTAKCQLALYGRWCDLTINAYCLGENPYDATAVVLSYGIRPLDNRELRGSCLGAVPNGLLRLARGSGGNRQEFEQKIEFPLITGEFCEKHTVAGGGVPVARNLIRGILRGTESMVETIRQSIRCSFHESVRDLAIATLDDRYGQTTVRNLNTFLGEIHWELMLQKSGFDEQQYGCIAAMAAANPPRFYDVNFEGESDIALVGERPGDIVAGLTATIRLAQAAQRRAERYEEQLRRNKDREQADGKARSLLESICGTELALQFDTCGYITMTQNGYTFEIPANAFIRCTDPNGKRADLCIHTQGLQCNPIDEIIIAYLHIKHKLADYMKVAIIHGADRGFQKKVAA